MSCIQIFTTIKITLGVLNCQLCHLVSNFKIKKWLCFVFNLDKGKTYGRVKLTIFSARCFLAVFRRLGWGSGMVRRLSGVPAYPLDGRALWVGLWSDVTGGAARLRCSSQVSSTESRCPNYDITVNTGPCSLDSLPPGIESDVLSLPWRAAGCLTGFVQMTLGSLRARSVSLP